MNPPSTRGTVDDRPASAPSDPSQPAAPDTGFRSNRAADRFMRRLLRVTSVDPRSSRGAHRALRVSVVLSGIRCLISYVLIPILVPVLHLAGWVATPVGMALCVVAVVNGIISLRRFWRADHRSRWMYTVFVAVVFAIVAFAVSSDVIRLGATP